MVDSEELGSRDEEETVRGGNRTYDCGIQDCTEEVVEIGIRCMYTNACSVIGKMDELSIRASNYDIIGITET